MSRIAVVAAAALLAAGCSSNHERTLSGSGLSLSLPSGWYGVAGRGQLQAANFPLARSVLGSAERAHVRRGHVHLIIWGYGPVVPYLAGGGPGLRGPATLRGRDLTGPFEGFPGDHAFAERSLTVNGQALQALADLGPKPADPARLREVNRVLRTLEVASSRIVRPHGRMLTAKGVSLPLLPGWSGRIEIPAATFAASLVVRARRGSTRLTLLELPPSLRSRRLQLPVALQRVGAHFGRRVFSTGGRNFDVSAVFTSPRGLTAANRLVAGLRLSRAG